MFKKWGDLTKEDKRKVSEMSGKMLVWMTEGRSTGYMSDKLNIHPRCVESNIDEMLYVLRRRVGLKRYLKVLLRHKI